MIWGGGVSGFSVFSPNVNIDSKCFSWTKNKLVLKWFLGNFNCVNLMFFSEAGSQNSKFSWFQMFAKLGLRGGASSKTQFFPNEEKSKSSGCGGWIMKKNWFFPLFWTFYKAPLCHEQKQLQNLLKCLKKNTLQFFQK